MSSAIAIPPPAPPAERPTAVTVIGWVWIVYAAVKLFGGVWGLVAWRLGGLRDFVVGPGSPTILPMAILRTAFGRFAVALTAQILFASAVLIAATALLRMRPWARTAIEVLSWLGLCYVGTFGLVWIWVWRRTALDASRPESTRFAALAFALGAVVVLAFAFVSMIRALRSEEVRRAFRGGPA